MTRGYCYQIVDKKFAANGMHMHCRNVPKTLTNAGLSASTKKPVERSGPEASRRGGGGAGGGGFSTTPIINRAHSGPVFAEH